MADLDKSKTNPEEQLFDHLGGLRAGMLGVEGAGQHMQPMSHFLDREGRALWFITSAETDLVRAVGQGATAKFTVTSEDQDYFACLMGTLTQSQDSAKLDELWSPAAAAWFEQGRDDPRVTLLHMPLREAAIWASTGSALKFGLQIAKAQVTGETPDVGEHVVLNFRDAA